MFHILIVEDTPNLLDELRDLFEGLFPGSRIEPARAVNDALQLIKTASSSGWFYDLAVLDLKLPKEVGAFDEVDGTICREIKELGYNTLIIHITGFSQEPEVVKHLKEFHDDSGDPQSRLIDKDDRDFPDNLKKKAKEYLYGGLIEEQMDNLFGPSQRTASARAHSAARSRSNAQGSITPDLADLSRDIVAHWDDLDEKLKCRIRDRFHVNTEGGTVRISLLG